MSSSKDLKALGGGGGAPAKASTLSLKDVTSLVVTGSVSFMWDDAGGGGRFQ